MQENYKSTLYASGIFALVCLGILALSSTYSLLSADNLQDKKTFTVQGIGEVKTVPNKAVVSATFSFDAKTGAEATKLLSDNLAKAQTEFANLGIKKEEIQTENTSLSPKYEYCYNFDRISLPEYCKVNPSASKVIGYTASQNISLSFTIDGQNTETIEKTIASLANLGVMDVNGPNFEVDDKKTITEARQKATQDAKEKAQAIANSLGKKLGDVVYYNETKAGGPEVVPYMMKSQSVMSSRDAVSVPISQGQETVSISVDITYELK
jgi:uncharacterized protein YggE